ncbi:hypothetical protein AKJ60_00305 [candidate division MSBL1 archaeon SCGC-AAA385M11]|nr:hypothetical protein AKJ60_00305 [candidate division MSBL1 archaeon SCGC-AAA385M11]
MSKKTWREELLDVNQASRELGILPSSVYRLIHAGKISVSRYGPVYGLRIKRSEVERYKKNRERDGLEA